MKEFPWQTEKAKRRENPWVWAILIAILVLYIFSVLRLDPVATFGNSADDALYFSSAKALSTGQGYILPSFPVRLRATKYPELYPLLLAAVWKVDPHFPDNVNIAVGLTLAFGCSALLFTFLLLRRWPSLGDWPAISVVGLCAFTGYFLDLSASVMTDVPFMAMLWGAMWLVEGQDRRSRNAFGAGILTGLSVGLRSLGVAAVAGIGLVLLVKRDFQRLLWYSVAVLPLTLLWLWPRLSAMVHPPGTPLVLGLSGSGWAQTLCYYSSYACSWRMGVTAPKALEAIVYTNLKNVIQEPGLYLLSPLATGGGIWSLVLVSLVGVAAYAGIIRNFRNVGWQPLTAAFAFYLLVLLPWPYTPQRFLVAFLPLLFGGLWIEARHFTYLITEHLRPVFPMAQRAMAVMLAVGSVALFGSVVLNCTYAVPVQVGAQAAENQRFLRDQQGAYAWIRQHAAADAHVIAYEDGLFYLYTGRKSVVPIACLTQSFYEDNLQFAEHDAAELIDVARHIGAAYWLTTVRDFALDGNMDYAVLQQRQGQLLSAATMVYRSKDGKVQLYDVRSLTATNKSVSGSALEGEPPRAGGHLTDVVLRSVSRSRQRMEGSTSKDISYPFGHW